MARNATRPKFTPKPLDLSEPVVWVLKRAFGPPDRDVSTSDPEAALEAADLLGYLPRIGQRTPRARLESELGEANASRVLTTTHRVAAGATALNATAHFIREVAREHGLPCLFLKYSALSALGVARPGSRLAMDVDVLSARSHGGTLVSALLDHGCRAVAHRRHEHELPLLAAPLDVSIDAHRYIPGVRLDARGRFVAADDLLAAGLVDATTNAPVPPVLAAHALVHGFVENAPIPQSGAAARALADLVDLEHFARGTVEQASPLLELLFDRRDITEVAALCLALQLAQIEPGYDAPGAAILSHVLAASLDAQYAASLRRFLLHAPLSERTGPGPRLERIARILAPTADELSRIYGPPSGALGVFGLRLRRPLDLAARTFRLISKR